MNLLTNFRFQRKTFGEPDVVDGPQAVEFGNDAIAANESSPQTIKITKTVSAPREDGLVREEKENRVVSREDTTEVTEVEDVHHFGDFSDAVSLHIYYYHSFVLSSSIIFFRVHKLFQQKAMK